jgi:hypothetical protein
MFSFFGVEARNQIFTSEKPILPLKAHVEKCACTFVDVMTIVIPLWQVFIETPVVKVPSGIVRIGCQMANEHFAAQSSRSVRQR